MFSKILLPLDGSELAAQAVPYALEFAKATGAEVLVVRVIDSEAQIIAQTTPVTIEPLPSGRITAEIAEEAVAGQRRSAQETLEGAKSQLEAAGVTVTTQTLEGDPGRALVDVAAREDVDVVVMATRGRSGFKRALLGSVADHMVRETPGAAVMLIRPVAGEE